MSNVLVTCAGRRVPLVEAFQAAAHRRGARVIAADSHPLAPALFHADEAVRVPALADEAYQARLLDVVEQHGISLLVPTIDTELLALALARDDFADRGCHALISSPEFVRICSDKMLTASEFAVRGVEVPLSWSADEAATADLPKELFVKPRNGSSSIDTHAVTRDRLGDVLEMVRDPLVQERLTGREVTVDALLDLDGRPIHFVPRTRLKTLGGESIQGVTLRDEVMQEWIIGVLEQCTVMGARGPITLQFFDTERGPVLIEVNPRFGGGFPLTNAAGGTYPAWLLEMATGEPVAPRIGDYQEGLYMTRHLVETFTDSPKW